MTCTGLLKVTLDVSQMTLPGLMASCEPLSPDVCNECCLRPAVESSCTFQGSQQLKGFLSACEQALRPLSSIGHGSPFYAGQLVLEHGQRGL